jgi:hypothetical protein
MFTLQKKIIGITASVGPINSCRSLFKRLRTIPSAHEYIISVMKFIVSKREHVQTNLTLHGLNTKNKLDLQRPAANLLYFQTSA